MAIAKSFPKLSKITGAGIDPGKLSPTSASSTAFGGSKSSFPFLASSRAESGVQASEGDLSVRWGISAAPEALCHAKAPFQA